MLCDNCKKNEANVKYTQIINGVKKEMNLCEECSQKLGISNNWSMPIDFSSFLGDFIGDYTQAFSPLIQGAKVLKCNKCNRTYDDFISTGKFGCDNCYEVFSNNIDSLLKRVQGSNRYTGKRINFTNKNIDSNNKEENKKDKIKRLKIKINELVKLEKYEEAAKVRDEIKKLEMDE